MLKNGVSPNRIERSVRKRKILYRSMYKWLFEITTNSPSKINTDVFTNNILKGTSSGSDF